MRQARVETAEVNLDRIQPLAALDAASKSDLDHATGQAETTAFIQNNCRWVESIPYQDRK